MRVLAWKGHYRSCRFLAELAEDPFHKPPPDEKLVGDLAGVRRRALD